jgi:hypothetical protein
MPLHLFRNQMMPHTSRALNVKHLSVFVAGNWITTSLHLVLTLQAGTESWRNRTTIKQSGLSFYFVFYR